MINILKGNQKKKRDEARIHHNRIILAVLKKKEVLTHNARIFSFIGIYFNI